MFFLLIVCTSSIYSQDSSQAYTQEKEAPVYDRMSELFRDLQIVEGIRKENETRFPVFFNHYNHVGYFSNPTSRTSPEGTVFMGFSWVPPYRNFSMGFQLFDRLEISGSYRVFRGIQDVNLSSKGFGDYADKGADFKLVLLHPEESGYQLPGIAVGSEDFIGSKLFQTQYVALTQVFPALDMEATIGYGNRRFNGFFGGLLWMPFRQSPYSYLQNIALVGEYDATDYENPNAEPHPSARLKSSPINYGVKYRLWDSIDLSVSHVRGEEIAASATLHADIGNARGMLPKLDVPLPYSSPVNTEQLGYRRPKTVLVQELINAAKEHGLEIRDVYLSSDKEHRHLRLTVSNKDYNHEYEMREQLNGILAALIPDDIEYVDVRIYYAGLPCHEMRFRTEDLRRYQRQELGDFELAVLTPHREINHYESMEHLFHKKQNWWNFKIRPRWQNYFGNASGKFKYDIGVTAILDGYLWNNIYYACQGTYSLLSSISDVGDRDSLNPSLIINVRSDSVKYRQQDNFIIERLFLQKHWNMGNGYFSRVSAGHFEAAFGGGASEFLYYPVGENWALGLEAAVLKKREFNGLKFSNRVRRLVDVGVGNYQPTYHHLTAYQLLADVYFDLPMNIDARFRFGQFLAKDQGVKMEFSRSFSSGLRLHTWYSITDAVDLINGERYFDYGIGFSLPLDLYYTYNSRDRWGYKVAPWLRDIGATSSTGRSLYGMIKEERRP
ncbi:Uncharacterized protein SCG7109_AB_00120 [Chlamydiales bacterium SCGC AG-110-M15]|nr:Uncharacterized protein SCG7109_AB_00120 [Chlamydiales bacterium SCGC AG-110-M15]